MHVALSPALMQLLLLSWTALAQLPESRALVLLQRSASEVRRHTNSGYSRLHSATKHNAKRRVAGRKRLEQVKDSYSCPYGSRHEVIFDSVPGGFQSRSVNERLSLAQLPPNCSRLQSHQEPLSLAMRSARQMDSRPRPAVIPYPASLELAHEGSAGFRFSRAVRVDVSGGVQMDDLAIKLLLAHVANASKNGTVGEETHIHAQLDANSSIGREGYRLIITHDTVNLTASAPAGIFYGVQTLKQLTGTNGEIPALTIEDKPMVGWRGLLLDVSRHFFGAAEVKRLLDVMAAFKYNVFHWHLTDDQGWRLPIKNYPRLTQIGAESVNGAKEAYTVQEIRDIVKYAQDRFIDVLPEVDVPGHTTAAIAAYPELGNTDMLGWRPPSSPTKLMGVMNYTLGPSDATTQFLKETFKQVAELFPFPYVHVGGDEAKTAQWDKSPRAQLFATMSNITAINGLIRKKDVQGIFTQDVTRLLRAYNKTLVGWDEVRAKGGLPDNAIIMAWRNQDELKDAVAAGHYGINAYNGALYFDKYQSLKNFEPEAIGGHLSLEQVYNYDPVPRWLPPHEAKLVKGAQAALWAEYFLNWTHVEYMAHPRSLALAERLWTPYENIQDFDNDFRARLEVRLQDLDVMGVNYRKLDPPLEPFNFPPITEAEF